VLGVHFMFAFKKEKKRSARNQYDECLPLQIPPLLGKGDDALGAFHSYLGAVSAWEVSVAFDLAVLAEFAGEDTARWFAMIRTACIGRRVVDRVTVVVAGNGSRGL
jgi:hypothetical protein